MNKKNQKKKFICFFLFSIVLFSDTYIHTYKCHDRYDHFSPISGHYYSVVKTGILILHL